MNDTIAIGESGPYRETQSSGAVWFFNLDGNLTNVLRSPIPVNSSYFGFSMTLFNGFLLIGDPGVLVDGEPFAGMVHVYSHNGTYLQSITSLEPMKDGEFGRSMACNDELLVIGEPGPQTQDENVTSRVHVYDQDLRFLYTIQQSEARTGCFGMSLAVNNDTIVIAEPYYDAWQGIVYLYDLEGNLLRNITSPFYRITRRPRNFGFRISANDNIIAIGEVRGSVEEHEFAGRAYIYDRNAVLLTNLTSLKPTGTAGFGYLLVLNDCVLIADYVRVDEFNDRLGAVIYDKVGDIRAVVSSRDYEWVRGSPTSFTDELVVLGDIIGESGGVTYAGNVYVCAVPDGFWDIETEPEDAGSNDFIVFLLIGAIVFYIIGNRDR